MLKSSSIVSSNNPTRNDDVMMKACHGMDCLWQPRQEGKNFSQTLTCDIALPLPRRRLRRRRPFALHTQTKCRYVVVEKSVVENERSKQVAFINPHLIRTIARLSMIALISVHRVAARSYPFIRSGVPESTLTGSE